LFMACTDKREKVIGDYVQTIGNVKTDMSFSLKKIKQLGSVTAQDSLDILAREYEKEKDEFIVSRNRQIKISKSQLEILENNVETFQTKPQGNYTKKEIETRIAEFKTIIENTTARIEDLTDQVNKVESNSLDGMDDFDTRASKELIELRNMQLRMQKYQSEPTLVLANKCRVTYKIKNPIMNNVKQEITKIFVFSSDNKKILLEVAE